MSVKPQPKLDNYLRREWRIEKPSKINPNKGYIPSHEREGFDEAKVIKLPSNFVKQI